MTRELLSASRINVGYDGKTVVANVDIHCCPGQMLCLIGPNGAGKSTILRTLSGLQPPVSGEVLLEGQSVRKMGKHQKARKMAVVLTEKFNSGMMTAYGIVSMGRTPYTGFFGRLSAEDRRIILSSMEAVGASKLANRIFMSLSDGEKQKVLIARALAQEPELILMDEPTSHLDIKHKIEVVHILNRLCRERNMVVVLALHDIDLALKACQNVMMIKNGAVQGCGSPEDIVGSDTIQELYDIRGARFDSLLGSVEIQGHSSRDDLFVVCGGGSGIPFFRAMSRMGCGVKCGILSENDIDYCVARDMELPVVSERAYEVIGEHALAEASEAAQAARYIIDAGFAVGQGNEANLALLRKAAAGKRVFSRRSAEEILRIYGPNSNVTQIEDIAALLERMDSYGKNS